MNISLTIKGQPITKKNSQRILKNFKTNRSFIGQSEQYTNYEEECLWKLKSQYHCEPVNYPVTTRCIYYLQTKRKTDLTNLIAATHDILVKAGILQDDNSNIVKSVDGSRVYYDKENPRVEIEITVYSEADILGRGTQVEGMK